MVSTVSPKAKATPTKPMPSCGNAAARTALPHPPNTSQKVPRNSAVSFLVIDPFPFNSAQPRSGEFHRYFRPKNVAGLDRCAPSYDTVEVDLTRTIDIRFAAPHCEIGDRIGHRILFLDARPSAGFPT